MLALMILTRVIAGPQPQIENLQYGFHSVADCKALVAKYETINEPGGFTSDGRVILMKKYQCVYFNNSDFDDFRKLEKSAQ